MLTVSLEQLHLRKPHKGTCKRYIKTKTHCTRSSKSGFDSSVANTGQARVRSRHVCYMSQVGGASEVEVSEVKAADDSHDSVILGSLVTLVLVLET